MSRQSESRRYVLTSFTCELREVGPETIRVVGRSYATTRIEESCAGPLAAFLNSYCATPAAASGGRGNGFRQRSVISRSRA